MSDALLETAPGDVALLDRATIRPGEGSDLTDENLLAALRVGRDWSLRLIYERYAGRIGAFVLARVSDTSSRDDVVQEIFVSLWFRRQELRVHSSLKAYLFQSAYYASQSVRKRNAARRLKIVSWDSGVDAGLEHAPGIESAIDANSLGVAYASAKDALPRRCREVYVLVRDCRLTYAETATVLSISEKTVERHMGRALTGLRQALSAWL